MDFELKDIKDLRKKFGLTQSQLAKRADVSQSLIAKVEAGRLDPTFSNAQKIFSALKFLSEKQESFVSEVMTRKIISVVPDSSLQDVIGKMRKFGISQLPVIDKDKSVGLLSEAIVLDALLAGKKDSKAKDLMRDSPPVITVKAALSVASNLLRYYPIVLISEKGKLVGLVSKADIIGSFTPKKKYGIF